jgi:hypothetical protein
MRRGNPIVTCATVRRHEQGMTLRIVKQNERTASKDCTQTPD